MWSLSTIKLPKFKKLLPVLKSGCLVLAATFKYLFAGSVVFIFIPQLFIHAEIGPRLNANIYDFYGFLILIWLSYKSFVVSRDIKAIKEDTIVHISREQIGEGKNRSIDIIRLQKLKRKLDKRRKK